MKTSSKVKPSKIRRHRKMALPALRQLDLQPLNPDMFYRHSDGWRYFGYSISRLDDKIKTGEIPKPIPLSDEGRAKGWFGRTIIAWQKELEAKAAAKAED